MGQPHGHDDHSLSRTSEAAKPSILIVGAFPSKQSTVFGGIVTSCRALLESSLPTRATLTLVDSTQISNPPPRLATRLLLAGRRFVTYVRLLERERPKAVVLFTSIGASIVEKGLMAWYARARGVAACVFPRGGPLLLSVERSWWSRVWVRAALRGSSMILCQGPVWQRFARDILGLPAERSPIIPNWTATDSLLEIGRARLPSRKDRPVRLLFVGWLERDKGVFELIEACSRLADSRPFSLEIVGDGFAAESVRERLVERGLSDRVVCSGWLDTDGVERALRDADVFVLPSWSEGLPNAMIEAAAAGLALVVSSVGAVPDVMHDGFDALIVPPRDVDALTEALSRVIDDATLRDQLGREAFALAEREFGVESAVDRLLDAVDTAIQLTARPEHQSPGIARTRAAATSIRS